MGTKTDAGMIPINKVACGTCTRDGEYAKTVEIVANRKPAKPWCTPTEIVENRNEKHREKQGLTMRIQAVADEETDAFPEGKRPSKRRELTRK